MKKYIIKSGTGYFKRFIGMSNEMTTNPIDATKFNSFMEAAIVIDKLDEMGIESGVFDANIGTNIKSEWTKIDDELPDSEREVLIKYESNNIFRKSGYTVGCYEEEANKLVWSLQIEDDRDDSIYTPIEWRDIS